MSGGSYDYAFYKVDDFIETLEENISKKKKTENQLRTAFAEHLKKVSAAMKAVEWVDSGDRSDGAEVEEIQACLHEQTRLFTLRECAEIVHDLHDNYKGHLQGLRKIPDILKRRRELVGGTVALADIESQIEDLIEQEEPDWLKELAKAEQERIKEARLSILEHCLEIARVEAEDLNDAWEVHRKLESLMEAESEGE